MNSIAIGQPRQRRTLLPARGGEMAILDFGPRDRAADIVFSHANGFNARTYSSILQPLSAGLRILAIDMRGHGATTLPASVEGREGWEAFADDLCALLAVEADGPVVLAGHSMGGTASVLAAAAEPARVRALALFDPVLVDASAPTGDEADNPLARGALRRRARFPDKAAAVDAYRGRGAFRTWSAEQLEDYVDAGFAPTSAGEVALTCAPEWESSNFRTHIRDPWAALLGSTCPIRILQAETGSTTQLGARRMDADTARRIRFETVPGTTHFLPMERPDVVRRVLCEVAEAEPARP